MGDSRDNHQQARWPLLIPLLALVCAPFVGGDLLTDDFVHVQRLTSVTGISDVLLTPDAFRFYRPVTQAGLAIELALHGDRPVLFRVVNLALHAAVLAMALVVARLILLDETAAALATLAFALTPKAPAIVVLWISGRAELLMALFTFASVAAWIMWIRRGGPRWLIAAAVAYVLAAASKETAFLLPLLFVFVPNDSAPATRRAAAIAMMVAVGAALFAWRSHTGALTPLSSDVHYDLLTGVARVLRSLRNYIGRMLPAPALLIAVMAIARTIDARRSTRAAGTYGIAVSMLVHPLVWMLLFLAPVLPIVARSEIYLYLPTFGMCLVAAVIARATLFGVAHHRAAVVAVGVFVLALAGYQASRAATMHDDLDFSARLVAALRADTDLAASGEPITLVPADLETERYLQDSIGGYLYSVLHRAFPQGTVTGVTEYSGMRVTGSTRRVQCRYRDRRVTLSIEH
jgi:hypothetical protein